MESKAMAALEPFVLLSKSATSPRAAADLIVQATSAPSAFVFAELLETPNIQNLASSADYSKFLELLKIFVWGSYMDYQAKKTDLPDLSEAQTKKLRLLSLISLASSKSPSEALTYSNLLTQLGLPSNRDLEALVIEAIYEKLVSGKLDPRRQLIEIYSVAGRDVPPDGVPQMISTLESWSAKCEGALKDIEAQIAMIHKRAAEKKHTGDLYDDLVDERKKFLFKEPKSQGKSQGKRTAGDEPPDDFDDEALMPDEMDLDEGSGMGALRRSVRKTGRKK
jgi:COP9 signalosome complex subunit 7